MSEPSDNEIRHSSAHDAPILTDPDEVAAAEGRNGLKQIDGVIEIVELYTQEKRIFKLRPSMLLQLHRLALDGLSRYAGNYRPAGIQIQGSSHQPVGAYQVPEMVEEMCDYVNEHWADASALHLAAYVLWRLNWIHPFTDGNGRTARACSYLVLCLRLGYPIYAPNTVPAQIAANKNPYYTALEDADKAFSENKIDVSSLEKLLRSLLARQMLGIVQTASGKSSDEEPESFKR